jgi:hypothetical protein
MVKEFSQKITKTIEDFQLPVLDKLLSSKYGFISSKCVCEKCGYVAKNQHALSCHKRGSCGKQLEPIPPMNIQLQAPSHPVHPPLQQKPIKILTKTIVTPPSSK